MAAPPKKHLSSESEYRSYFESEYCQGPVFTFDQIPVYFRKSNFDHCMFESSRRDGIKDLFSRQRAERIDWIKATLTNPAADFYTGWDSARKRHDNSHRVAVVYQEFVVIIRLRRDRGGGIVAADFVTAYLAENSIAKIRSAPRWTK